MLPLAVSLKWYRWARRIVLARLTYGLTYARKGVLVGSVCVTYELLLSFVERCDRHVERVALRGMRLAVHVGDFFQTLEAEDPEMLLDVVAGSPVGSHYLGPLRSPELYDSSSKSSGTTFLLSVA